MTSTQDEGASKKTTRNTRSNSNGDLTVDFLRVLLREQKEEIIRSLSSKVDELNVKVTELVSKIRRLEDTVALVCDKQEAQQAEINNLRGLVQSSTNVESLLDEMQQRSIRANNLIISGLPEKNSGSVEERNKHDLSEFERLSNFLKISGVKVTENFRIGGARQDGNRLLKVKLGDQTKTTQFLRKSRSLRNTEFNKIFISPDRTPVQQSEYKELRRGLKERRDMGEDVVIYRGRIQEKSSLKNFRQ
jgi:hypothetical protein